MAKVITLEMAHDFYREYSEPIISYDPDAFTEGYIITFPSDTVYDNIKNKSKKNNVAFLTEVGIPKDLDEDPWIYAGPYILCYRYRPHKYLVNYKYATGREIPMDTLYYKDGKSFVLHGYDVPKEFLTREPIKQKE